MNLIKQISRRGTVFLTLFCVTILYAARLHRRLSKLSKLKLTPIVSTMLADWCQVSFSMVEKATLKYPNIVLQRGPIAVVEMRAGLRLLLDAGTADASPAILARVRTLPNNVRVNTLPTDSIVAILAVMLSLNGQTPRDSNHLKGLLRDKQFGVLGLGSGEVYTVLSKIAEVSLIEPSTAVVDSAFSHFLLGNIPVNRVAPLSLKAWMPRSSYSILVTDLTRAQLNSDPVYLKKLKNFSDYVVGVAMHPMVKTTSIGLISDVHCWAAVFSSVVAITASRYHRVLVASSSSQAPICKDEIVSLLKNSEGLSAVLGLSQTSLEVKEIKVYQKS
eukprot:TRINITY_DN6866_c0_g1_i2.p1 TRINITY_DN6866_c0_g1~~TRINITY_DN6866_c0_g1_i2.p1  ORF type:complete len:338 (+),score=26.05 TRINITY_DN6866_c0_g1_i2:23-1015(+)